MREQYVNGKKEYVMVLDSSFEPIKQIESYLSTPIECEVYITENGTYFVLNVVLDSWKIVARAKDEEPIEIEVFHEEIEGLNKEEFLNFDENYIKMKKNFLFLNQERIVKKLAKMFLLCGEHVKKLV